MNPKIVYARGSGQGHRGPDAEAGGNENIAYWSRSGVSYLLADADSDGPIPQCGAIGDAPSGVSLAAGVLAALLQVARTGTGVEVNASLFNTGMWTLAPDIALASVTGGVPARHSRGSAQPHGPLTNRYRTADGRDLALSMTNERRYWPRACRALGLDDLIVSHGDASARLSDRVLLIDRFAQAVAHLAGADAADRLRAEDCVFGFVNTPLDVLNDPAAIANGYLLRRDDDANLRIPAAPAQFDNELPALRRSAPQLGEHSREIVSELGYFASETQRLLDDGVIGADPHRAARH